MSKSRAFGIFGRPLLATLALTFAALGTSQAQPVKVLFWAGGVTAHSPKFLRDTLATYLPPFNIQMTYRADSTNDPVWLHPDTLAQYDVMLLYTTNQDANRLSQTRLNNLIAWVNSGRVLVALHGSTNTYINNNAAITTAWQALLGAKYVGHGPVNSAGTITRTTAGNSHASLLGTTMLPASAANTGGSPYWDEGREHVDFVSDTIVLARSATTGSFPWIWVRPQGNGWVYYNASGHDGQVWKMDEWKTQVRRALMWGYQIKTTGIRGKAALERLRQPAAGADGILRVPFDAKHSVEILDIQGRTKFFRGNSYTPTYDLGFLPAGTYGVRILSEGQDAYRGLYVKTR